MLMRLCGFSPVPLCGFCAASADFFSRCVVFAPVLHSLGCDAHVGMRIQVKLLSGVARIGSSRLPHHVARIFARPSRYSGASAASLVVAFVSLAAFACVHSATARGHPDFVEGGCLQPVCAAMLAALRAASFVFVLLVDGVLFFVQESDGVHGFCGIGVLKIWFVFIDGMLTCAIVVQCIKGVLTILCSCGSCKDCGCTWQQVKCVCWRPPIFCRCHRVRSQSIDSDFWRSVLLERWRASPKIDRCWDQPFFSTLLLQASGCVIADGDEELVQGSGEQGAVSILPVGLGQVGGRP